MLETWSVPGEPLVFGPCRKPNMGSATSRGLTAVVAAAEKMNMQRGYITHDKNVKVYWLVCQFDPNLDISGRRDS